MPEWSDKPTGQPYRSRNTGSRLRPTRSAGHGYAVVHWKSANRAARSRRRAARTSISDIVLMPVDTSSGSPVRAMASSIGVVPISPDATFQPGTPTRVSSSTASIENGELMNREAGALCVPLQSGPLLFRELHPLPVVVAAGVLRAERHTPWLRRRALRSGDVRLELHGVGARSRDGVDVGVSGAEAPVVRLRDFAHDQAPGAEPRGASEPRTQDSGRHDVVVRHALEQRATRRCRQTSAPCGGSKAFLKSAWRSRPRTTARRADREACPSRAVPSGNRRRRQPSG